MLQSFWSIFFLLESGNLQKISQKKLIGKQVSKSRQQIFRKKAYGDQSPLPRLSKFISELSVYFCIAGCSAGSCKDGILSTQGTCMSQSLADVILHLVFSTKERRPWLQPAVQEELYQYICGICHNINSPVMQINGVEDHIHILLHLGKNISTSKLVSEIKSNSSRWIKTKGDFYNTSSWQSGYGAFSVSKGTLDGAKKYIASQKERHKTISFKDELLMMLDRAQITYDEKYLWDYTAGH